MNPLASLIILNLNGERFLKDCFESLRGQTFKNFEIIFVDNGSADQSVLWVEKNYKEVKIIRNKANLGFAKANNQGFELARGKYIIIGDSDATYDFSEIMKFIEPLRRGYEFVNGSRMKGKIHGCAMSFLHRYFGNPLLSLILNLFFKSGFSDVYCGMKAFTKEAYEKIRPISPGMEFALELVINASRLNLKRIEVPVVLYPRKGVSKLRTFRDGWRSLRFMLLYSPIYLFIIPGILIFLSGSIGIFILLNGPIKILNHTFDFHAMIFSSMLTILGFQLVNLGLFAKSYAIAEGFEKKDSFFSNFYKFFNLEKGILVGGVFVITGLFIAFSIIRQWLVFGSMSQERAELFASTLIIIGIQVIFSSFLISLIGMKNCNYNMKKE